MFFTNLCKKVVTQDLASTHRGKAWPQSYPLGMAFRGHWDGDFMVNDGVKTHYIYIYSQVKLVLSKTSAHPTIMGFLAMGT